jgi:predicted RNase H-like nuclease (RuvC/YqgF family)
MDQRANETIHTQVMGVGKYNAWVIFKVQGEADDTYGGVVQTFTYDYQEGVVYRVKGQLSITTVTFKGEDERVIIQTAYNLQIRANTTWRPQKGMIVGVDDGYRVFEASILSVKGTNMKREFWDLKIVEVE